MDIGCAAGETASPDVFLSMLPHCGDRVNVVAVGVSTSEFARLMRERTPTNVLNLTAPEALAHVLNRSYDKIAFVLVSGDGDAAGENALDEVLNARNAHSPRTVMVVFGEPVSDEAAEGEARRDRFIAVPAEDPLTTAEAARRGFAAVTARCPDLFQSANPAGGARHCQLEP